MDHLITFAIAFAGALLAFALQRGMLIDEIRASRLEAERHASRFREDHSWMVVIAAEIDDAVAAHPERSNAAILEGLRNAAKNGAKFTADQIGLLRPEDVGRARHWHVPGSAKAPSERFFYQRVEKTLDQVAVRLERYPELARSIARAPFAAARECGLLAPPDAGPEMDSVEHVRWLADRERDESARTRRVHATVRVLRSVGGTRAESKPAMRDGSEDASAHDQDE